MIFRIEFPDSSEVSSQLSMHVLCSIVSIPLSRSLKRKARERQSRDTLWASDNLPPAPLSWIHSWYLFSSCKTVYYRTKKMSTSCKIVEKNIEASIVKFILKEREMGKRKKCKMCQDSNYVYKIIRINTYKV